MKIRNIFLFTVAGIFLAGCAPQMGAVVIKPGKPFVIDFVVVGGGTKLKIVPGGTDNGCGMGKNGCLRVPTANSGEITFEFQSAQPLPCSAHSNSWILSKIELANIEGDFGKPVNQWIVDDFGADASNGLVWQKAAGEEVVSHTIIDQNDHSGDAYYLITADSCGDKDPINSDPRIINEG